MSTSQKPIGNREEDERHSPTKQDAGGLRAVENPSPRNLATSLPKRYGLYMPRARSLVVFCLPLLILIPLSLLLHSYLVDAVNSLLASRLPHDNNLLLRSSLRL